MVLSKEMRRVMSVGDEVDEVGALVPNFEGQPEGLPLPCGQLEARESIVSVVTVADDVHVVVFMRDKVVFAGAENDEVGALAPHFKASKFIFERGGMLASIDEAVFKRKLCSLLASLEAASPGSAKTIACLLTEKTSMNKIKKAKKALRSIDKNDDVIGKTFVTA
ncbi:hypothetical protein D1007_58990 [Hordeum vulgare]|nr:hypothetical protein D1007_58990 [Hordeum vulgare]